VGPVVSKVSSAACVGSVAMQNATKAIVARTMRTLRVIVLIPCAPLGSCGLAIVRS
jgi:hypothetical protein